MRYRGSCHCKAVKFEVETPEITEALQCNCSICIRKNAIMSKACFSKNEITFLSGQDNLSVYHWGDQDVNHYFCKTCGIYPFHNTAYDPEVFRVNLGCLEELEPRKLQIIEFNGREEL